MIDSKIRTAYVIDSDGICGGGVKYRARSLFNEWKGEWSRDEKQAVDEGKAHEELVVNMIGVK